MVIVRPAPGSVCSIKCVHFPRSGSDIDHPISYDRLSRETQIKLCGKNTTWKIGLQYLSSDESCIQGSAPDLRPIAFSQSIDIWNFGMFRPLTHTEVNQAIADRYIATRVACCRDGL